MPKLVLTPHLILGNRLQLHTFRYMVILLISLVITHLLSYNRLPFSVGYTFPWTPFLIITFFGMFICTANWAVYYFIDLPVVSSYWLNLRRRLLVQMGSTLVFYTGIYMLVIIGWFHAGFSTVHFLKYLFISCSIIGLEFLLVELIKSHQKGDVRPSLRQVYIRAMKKDVLLPYSSIEMLHSSNGIVTLYSNEHKPLITRYSSLEELEKILPVDQFYRINRQYLINRQVVKSVSRNDNRTLDLTLEAHGHLLANPIQISRYKRSEFLRWLENM